MNTEPVAQDAEPPTSNLRRVARILIWVAVAYVVVVIATVAVGGFLAWRGVADLNAAKDSLTFDTLGTGDADVKDELESAKSNLDKANRVLGGFWIAPLRVVPFVGTQLRAAEGMAKGSSELVGAALSATDEADDALEASLSEPAKRVAALESLAATAEKAQAELAEIDFGPSDGLIGPVAAVRERLDDQVASVGELLAKTRVVADGAARLLAGPSHCLFVAANNSQMQGGNGMMLMLGTLDAENGKLSFDEPVSISDVKVGGDVPVEADKDALWGDQVGVVNWRRLGITPRFPVEAEQAAEMWRSAGNGEVDCVILADADVLFALVDAVGTVAVGDQEMDAGEVIYYVLEDQYRQYDDYSDDENDRRQDELGILASEVMGRIEDGDVDAGKLAGALRDAVAGRHLMIWSRDPTQEKAWEAAGVAGVVGPDSIVLALINIGGNKVDAFLDVESEIVIDADPDSDQSALGRIAVEVANSADPGDDRYIVGPHGAFPELEAGDYRGFLTVNLPKWATDVTAEGENPIAFSGSDGDTDQYVIGLFVLPTGETMNVDVRFKVPRPAAVDVISSPRIPPILWRSRGLPGEHEWDGNVVMRLEW